LCNKLSTVPTYLFSSSAAIAHHMTIVKQAEKSLSQPRPLALFRWSRKNSVWKPLYSVNKAKAAPLPPYRQQEGAEVYFLVTPDLGTRWRVSGQHHTPAVLYLGERTPGTHCIGGWVGLRAGLEIEA
jgi:hypothetical protein